MSKITRDDAWAHLCEWTETESLRKHARAVEIVMRSACGRYGEPGADVEQWGGSAKVCGAGAITGDKGGIVLVFADHPPAELCLKYGYTVSPVRGDPLGTRIV